MEYLRLQNDVYGTEWEIRLVDWQWKSDNEDEYKILFHGVEPAFGCVREYDGFCNGTEVLIRNWNDGSDGSTVIDYPIPGGVALDLPKAK